MALDPLAERLEILLAHGSIVASQVSPAMRARLVELFASQVLSETRSGSGRRVVVRNQAALRNWITRHYPSGLGGVTTPLPPRAEALANFAHSKRGRGHEARPVFLRGFGQAVLRRGNDCLPLAELTRSWSVAAILVGPEMSCGLSGSLALVENFESFLHVERILPAVDAALWTGGRVDQRVLDWLLGAPHLRIVHFGDYDPVGLAEYLRARVCLGERVSLFVPERFADLVARFGRADLLVDSQDELSRVRAHADAAVRSVLAELDRQGKGLEQEALLTGCSEV